MELGRIGVLMGGPSTEREVSLKSGKAVFEALKAKGIDAVSIDIKTDDPDENARLIKSMAPDCAFIALHGRFGEDGGIQSILDSLALPYTGSGAKASKLAMDKVASLGVFAVNGLKVSRYLVLEMDSYNPNWKVHNKMGFPLVIKPASHGSSIGLSIVDDPKGLDKAVELAFSFDPRAVVQEYIEGRETTVGILDEKPLPVVEIIPKNRFFDYDAKYHAGMTEYIVPARMEPGLLKKIQALGLCAHKALGCSGCSRVDIMINKYDEAFLLEINTIPGFTQTSLLPKAAAASGIDFTNLCVKLIELAYEKSKVKSRA